MKACVKFNTTLKTIQCKNQSRKRRFRKKYFRIALYLMPNVGAINEFIAFRGFEMWKTSERAKFPEL